MALPNDNERWCFFIMKQVVHVEGKNPVDFADAYNETCAELSRFTVERVQPISDTSMYVFYDIPDELVQVAEPERDDFDYRIESGDIEDETKTISLKIELVLPDASNRFCCECDNYDPRLGCPYRDGKIRNMDPACQMFNVVIGGNKR